MGMFDIVRCEYPLPAGAEKVREWQSKDLPALYCETYTIRADGTLWHTDYDVEDRGDKSKEGLERLIGSATPVNKREAFCADFSGDVEFYGSDGKSAYAPHTWWEFTATFKDGRLTEFKQTEKEEVTQERINQYPVANHGL